MDCRKVLHVHIPKCAGHSISAALHAAGMGNNWLRDPRLSHHDSIRRMRELNTIPHDTFVFSVVRNPYTRVYSLYSFLKKRRCIINSTFQEWVKQVHSTNATGYMHLPQVDFLRHEKGHIGVPHIFRFEELAEVEEIGITLPHMNKSGGVPTTDDFTEESVGMVASTYSEDFDVLGYDHEFSFDLWPAPLDAV